MIFEIQSSSDIEHFLYQVIAHGKILHSETIFASNGRYHVINFNTTFTMVPEATLIVYRFEKNELITARMEFSVAVPDLHNSITIKLSKTEVKRGENISIEITTNPHSFVAITGIDQSISLLDHNNRDITQMKATMSTRGFDSDFYEVAGRTSHSYPSKFKDIGMILFTNAEKFNEIGTFSTRHGFKWDGNYYNLETYPRFPEAWPWEEFAVNKYVNWHF